MQIKPAEVDACLREYFGFQAFRPGQRELIETILSGKDALGVLPTGGGKSLAYQLPAVLLPGLTVVVSPLIALIKDQVDAFNRRGGKLAVAIHSNMSSSHIREALELAVNGDACMLYIAPERFEYAAFRDRILALQPKLLVIDEAHCVNQWGFDFRPSYLALADVVSALRPTPVLSLTATATPAARKEIVHRLGLKKAEIFIAPFDRPNLFFEVQPCDDYAKMSRLHSILNETTTGSHIVYVGRRKDADAIAAELDACGFPAVAYHAGMDAESRRKSQDLWLSGKKPIVVATVAFGMGIDKPDVRSVIHYQHPASLESYYQEAGRAGRDGEPAQCVVLYSNKDISLAHFFIRNRYPSPQQVSQVLSLISPEGATAEDLRKAIELSDEQLNVALWVLLDQQKIARSEEGLLKKPKKNSARIDLSAINTRKDGDYRRLDAVISYCEDNICHRGSILRYFGESPARGYRCGNCSACTGRKRPAAKKDARPKKIEKSAGSKIDQGSVSGSADNAVLWQTEHRSFTIAELSKRQVQRNTGLAILGAIRDAGTALAASCLANVLRGARKTGYILNHPELLDLEQFGAESGRNYDDVLIDVLAMWAKGYLQPAPNNRLELTQKGMNALRGG